MTFIHQTSTWKELTHLAHNLPVNPINVEICIENLSLDFSHQNINTETLEKLIELSLHAKLPERIGDLFKGAHVNFTENRPALHTALRDLDKNQIFVNEQNVAHEIHHTLKQMQEISNAIRHKIWKGYSLKPIKNIINIGIGGSDLGPKFCIEALKDYTLKSLNYFFISDVDPRLFENTVEGLNPEETLFIVSSKSFTTPETLYNAKKAIAWIGQKHMAQHFIAITASVSKAKSLGYQTILPIWDWVGGRYSFWSAINLISYIALGSEHFQGLLQGAHQIDKHFQSAPLKQNIPVLLALLGIWNINFKSINNHLILTYATNLEKLTAYIQQLDMESNGKSHTKKNTSAAYHTGPIVWGGLGNQAQHSYYQLLCQGTHSTSIDFITVDVYENEIINTMAKAKMSILKNGVKDDSKEMEIKGNVSFNHIRLKDVSPLSIGNLIALYEHKIFVQSIIWDINAFDQPGVQSAKIHSNISEDLLR